VVFRGSREERRFIAFWMSGNRVVAGMSVNVWDVIGTVRALIEAGTETDDAVLADPSVPLESLLPQQARPAGAEA
jgi:hypothetical protein